MAGKKRREENRKRDGRFASHLDFCTRNYLFGGGRGRGGGIWCVYVYFAKKGNETGMLVPGGDMSDVPSFLMICIR